MTPSSVSRSSFFCTSPDTGSSASGGGGAFHSYPEKFPNARRKAAQFVQHIHAVTKKGPRTLVGTIVDTSFFHSQGYVTVTTELGVVSVYGVPYGSVVAGMRIFVRQMGGHATNRAYVYDGQAPNLSGLGMSSGSVVMTTPWVKTGTYSTSLYLLTAPSNAGVSAYYWHCFFYVPALPTSPATLLQMHSGPNTISLEYMPNGHLHFYSDDNAGYTSTQPVSPHQIHWFLSQPGIGGMEMIIDGNSIGTGTPPTFTGNGTSYNILLFSTYTASNVPQAGTWLSKIGWGTSVSGSTPIALSTSVPQSDSDLPSTGGTTTPHLLLLCSESVGASTLYNTATTNTISITTSYVTVLPTGPY